MSLLLKYKKCKINIPQKNTKEYAPNVEHAKKITCTHSYSIDARISYVYRIQE